MYFSGILKVEKLAHAAFCASPKCYVTFKFTSWEQIEKIASKIEPFGLLKGQISPEACLYDVDMSSCLGEINIKAKGNSSPDEINEFNFLDTILGISRSYTENRGIRRPAGKSELRIYSCKIESCGGEFSRWKMCQSNKFLGVNAKRKSRGVSSTEPLDIEDE